MRIIFLGTPEFAVPSLERLLEWPPADVVGLVTQPDRPAGRGKRLFAPPAKLVAERYGIPVLQPERLSKSPEIVQAMKDLRPDVLVTVAFGQILKKEVLTMAPLGVVNVHASLLPKYRGAAPVNWALINGEKVTGITTMFSDKGVDTGKMLLKREIPLDDNINALELSGIMSQVGADLLVETLDLLRNGTLHGVDQDDAQASMAPRLTKDMGAIDWTRSAREIHNLTRGLYPWPGTFCLHKGNLLKILRTAARCDIDDEQSRPGTINIKQDKVRVCCGASGREWLELLEVQPASRSATKAADWANGARVRSGDCLQSIHQTT